MGFERVRDRLGLHDVRVHELRHTHSFCGISLSHSPHSGASVTRTPGGMPTPNVPPSASVSRIVRCSASAHATGSKQV